MADQVGKIGSLELCIAQRRPSTVSESFLKAHETRLPCQVTVITHEEAPLAPRDQSTPTRTERMWKRTQGKLPKVLRKSTLSRYPRFYYRALRQMMPDAVLAQYGPTGVYVTAACRDLGIPFVVHFHGFDAHANWVIEQFGNRYRKMFGLASAVVAVSQPMVQQLISLGAPADKIKYIPYGTDCERFSLAQPDQSHPVFLAVGRFVDKKAPHLTLAAFRKLHKRHPECRLRMVGDGPLLSVCMDLAKMWKLEEAVTFLGSQPHDVVQKEMSKSCFFVQHSVVARNGDSEGMPVAIIEAGACGLPVISTRHAGIPEVIVEGETGLLVDEGDADEMAENMISLASDPALAARLSAAARQRVQSQFRIDQSINRLWELIQSCVEDQKVI